MKSSLAVLACSLLAFAPAAQAASHAPIVLTSSYKSAAGSVATGVAIALPLLAMGVTMAKHDRAGAGELLAVTLLSVGTAYGLNSLVREERPDGTSDHSLAPETGALAASSSTFLWGRYGWQYGLPAFAASDLVTFSLTQAKKAHWYDTLAGSFIATGYGLAITRRFRNRYNINTRLSAAPGGGFVSFSYEW